MSVRGYSRCESSFPSASELRKALEAAALALGQGFLVRPFAMSWTRPDGLYEDFNGLPTLEDLPALTGKMDAFLRLTMGPPDRPYSVHVGIHESGRDGFSVDVQALTDKELEAVFSAFERTLGIEPIQEEPVTSTSQALTVRLFISHSSADEALARLLVRLFRTALGLPPEAIRCTSIDGHRYEIGADTDERIRDEVLNSEILVAIISAASLESLYVAFELGARWGAGKTLLPILAPGTEASAMKGPLRGINALKCDRAGQLQQLVTDVASQLGITPFPPATYHADLEAILSLKADVVGRRPNDPQDRQPDSLSESARDLLLAAAKDKQGMLMRFRTLTGLTIKTNEQNFVEGNDPRSEARWESALQELRDLGLLQDRGSKGELFGLTRKGYDLADRAFPATASSP